MSLASPTSSVYKKTELQTSLTNEGFLGYHPDQIAKKICAPPIGNSSLYIDYSKTVWNNDLEITDGGVGGDKRC